MTRLWSKLRRLLCIYPVFPPAKWTAIFARVRQVYSKLPPPK